MPKPLQPYRSGKKEIFVPTLIFYIQKVPIKNAPLTEILFPPLYQLGETTPLAVISAPLLVVPLALSLAVLLAVPLYVLVYPNLGATYTKDLLTFLTYTYG